MCIRCTNKQSICYANNIIYNNIYVYVGMYVCILVRSLLLTKCIKKLKVLIL